MKKELCEIYNACFPALAMTPEHFEQFLLHDNTKLFTHRENGGLVGFALVEDFALRLLCVAPAMQRKGYGTALLREAEEYLRGAGYDRIITGGVSSGLFIGAVAESWEFFAKKGYFEHRRCDEMWMKLADFQYRPENFHGHTQAEYGWYRGSLKKLHQAVAAVDESWVELYNEPEKVFTGMVGDEIASFCLVDLDAERYLMDACGRVGMPGCVGTVPKFRNRGIGIEMIAIVTEYLKQQGMDTSFIFYTGVADWYAKLGYETFLTEVFGEKKLN